MKFFKIALVVFSLMCGFRAHAGVTVIGAEEPVFLWKTERCDVWDIPDAPFRAIRAKSGVVAFSSGLRSHRYSGADLDRLSRTCRTSFEGRRDADPAARSWNSYLTAMWTSDGVKVFALLHNEYLANEIPGRCRFSSMVQCWYNVVVSAVSNNAGNTFESTTPPSLVASLPMRQEVEQGRNRGFFNPSNIVAREGYFYFTSINTGGGGQGAGVCLFRSPDPFKPNSWRGWDGKGFGAVVIDPYHEDARAYVPCAPLNVPASLSSIVYVEPARAYLGTMVLSGRKPGESGGIGYAWSSDLIHWTAPKLTMVVSTIGSRLCSDQVRYAYPSIIDPGSRSRNFDTASGHAYLYVVRMRVKNCETSMDRDLVRMPIKIAFD